MTEPKISLKGKRKRRSIKFPFEDKYPIIKTIRKELGITNRGIKRMEDDLRTFGFLPEVDDDGRSYGVIAPGLIPDANINGLIQATKRGLIKNDAFVNAYEDLANFFSSIPYQQRLRQYLKNVEGLTGDLADYRIKDIFKEMSTNIKSAKPNVVKSGDLEAKGVWDSTDNSIHVVEDALQTAVPKHEMLHASDAGAEFLDNAKYEMRDIHKQWVNDQGIFSVDDLNKANFPNSIRNRFIKRMRESNYYGEPTEQRARVLNTLMDMDAKGYPINKLTQADIDEYFDAPLETLPTDAQSLLGNYVYEDILPALQNFKTVATPFVIGATGYGVKRRLESNGQKSK